MYPWELEKFIKDRNYQIGGEDLQKIISLKENPQLTQITLFPGINRYEMWDKEQHYYTFTVLPYEEGPILAKTRRKDDISK